MNTGTGHTLAVGLTLAAAIGIAAGGAGAQELAAPSPSGCATRLDPDGADAVGANRRAGLYDGTPGRRGVVHVPLNFYIVRRTDGTGAPPLWRIDTAVEDADAAFAGASIQFCRRFPLRYVDDDGFFVVDNRAEADLLRDSFGVPDSLNVFVVDGLVIDGNGVCAISSFTWSGAQGIVIDSACLGSPTNATTFPHEIGHYFDLLHTHETARGRECVDGSNCLTAGDLLCDTPADPGLGSHNVDAGCAYFGVERDTCDDAPYTPDPRNLMSSAPVACRDRLSPGQVEWSLATLANLRPGLGRADCDLCRADLDGDGAATTRDVVVFLDLFAGGSPSADWNGDLRVNTLDVLGFLGDWAGGC